MQEDNIEIPNLWSRRVSPLRQERINGVSVLKGVQ